ncbi:MAG: hypothetical protein AAGJ35_07440, partial [Myxococcota bacterium]
LRLVYFQPLQPPQMLRLAHFQPLQPDQMLLLDYFYTSDSSRKFTYTTFHISGYISENPLPLRFIHVNIAPIQSSASQIDGTEPIPM